MIEKKDLIYCGEFRHIASVSLPPAPAALVVIFHPRRAVEYLVRVANFDKYLSTPILERLQLLKEFLRESNLDFSDEEFNTHFKISERGQF